jgi:ADP-heptose:LPS heptosyltransferase
MNISKPTNDLLHPAQDTDAIEYIPSRNPFSNSLLTELKSPPRKVVILKASRIGDFINTTPAFRALRQALPEAEICVITLPMLLDIAERCQYIDRCLPFPGYPGLAEQFFKPTRALSFFQEMQAQQFDLAIQIQGTGVYSNPFMLMLGAKYTAGFVRIDDPPGLLSAALPWPTTGHEVRRNLALTEFLGAPTIGELPEFPLWEEDHAAADKLLWDVPKPWIGIHTSARDHTRRWPVQRFIRAAALLQQRFGGTILLISELRDREALELAAQETGAPCLNLAGRTTIPVTGAVLQRLSIFLTNDTGPAHIAYAVGAPTVTIFGGGDPNRNGPLTRGPHRILAHPIHCRPCETGSCPIDFTCLKNISAEQAADAAAEIFQAPT